eukprot:CAMPEP_0119322210 /NCGR_PEP_ID=MMETSP1333-20130426/57550_1 /TAXON_ID=418940 /ORGANISM="Scyphosphaera apsteinii, Strain RCC1455" /LENGTH=216 /DNA_ID=CAMNT_0007329375 /DNA_START=280 /DNA_END=926 /DNA_ORIENTATION=+
MPHKGAREKCFCAYAQLVQQLHDAFTVECPSWPLFVSTDGNNPDKVLHVGEATVLGKVRGNATAGHYGSIIDWAADLGSGFNRDCDRLLSPNCQTVGVHLLSIPRRRYIRDVFGLQSMLNQKQVLDLCALLRDMISAPLSLFDRLERYDSCRLQDEDPTKTNECVSQCFHIEPDVFYMHLHTTAGLLRVRNDPYNSGLGPNFNSSVVYDGYRAFGR